MKEVSCRHYTHWFRLIETAGGSVEKSIARLPYSRAYLQDPANRVDWIDHVRFCQDGVREMGGVDGVRALQQAYGNSKELRYLRRIVGLFASPRKIYDFVLLKHGPSLYTHLKFTVKDLPDGRLEVRMQIPEGYEDCPEFFWGSEQTFAGLPHLLGLPPAKIQTEVRERLGLYRLNLPASGTLAHRILRLMRWMAAPFGLMQFVERQQAELRRLIAELAAERDSLCAVVTSLASGIALLEEGKPAVVNPAMRMILGETPTDGLSELPNERLPEDVLLARLGERRMLETGRWVEILGRTPIQFESRPAEMLVLRDVTDRKRIEERIASAAFEERRQLARGIHDGLGQNLAALNFKAATAIATSDDPNGILKDILEILRETTRQANEIVYGLVPGDTEDDNLVSALTTMCQRIARYFETSCQFVSPIPSAQAVPDARGDIIFLVKEALTNAAKHSGARSICVSLQREDHGWQIGVSDDGCGFDPEPSTAGLGLESMRLRASQLGGTLELESTSGTGSKLVVRLPHWMIIEAHKSEAEAPASPPTASGPPAGFRKI